MKEARLRSFLYKMITLLLIGIMLVGAGVIVMLVINNRSGRVITNARYVMMQYSEVKVL